MGLDEIGLGAVPTAFSFAPTAPCTERAGYLRVFESLPATADPKVFAVLGRVLDGRPGSSAAVVPRLQRGVEAAFIRRFLIRMLPSTECDTSAAIFPAPTIGRLDSAAMRKMHSRLKPGP